jgi:uncharacterized protein YcfJ
MLVGIVAGAALATAGGVLGYQFLGQQPNEQGSAEVVVETPNQAVVARVDPAPTPAPVAQVTPQPAPARPAPRPPAPVQPAPAPVAAAAPAPVEECWDEEVTATEAPKDQHAIAGTAAGAVVGGALGNEISDRDGAKVVGAAAGAFIGRRLQRRAQENHEAERTTTTLERRCGPPGSAPAGSVIVAP